MDYIHTDKTQIDKLYHAFITAFSDYKIPLKLDPEDFRIRFFNKLKVQGSLSVAALDPKADVVGFIFHALQQYEGIPTLYNGGTGVIPAFRRRKVAYSMYEWIMPYLLNSKAQRIILEVISTNYGAIKLYEELGFTYKQTFKCYGLKDWSGIENDQTFQLVKNEVWDPKKYQNLIGYAPSFIDNDEQLKSNWINEILLEAFEDGELKGYVIFQPRISRISQIGFSNNLDVGRQLIKQVGLLGEREKVTILNISEKEREMPDKLENLGFFNELDQFEMEMLL